MRWRGSISIDVGLCCVCSDSGRPGRSGEEVIEELDTVREWPPARGEEGKGARPFRGTRRKADVFRGRSAWSSDAVEEEATEEDGMLTGI